MSILSPEYLSKLIEYSTDCCASVSRRGDRDNFDGHTHEKSLNCPPLTRSIPAKSVRENTSLKPACASNSRQCAAWSPPCSNASQPPLLRYCGADAIIKWIQSRPSLPAASAAAGSKRRSPCLRCGSPAAT